MSPAESRFDEETALEPVADGRWRGRVDPSWFVTTAPNGGFLAALAVRALELTTERPARSLTLHFLSAPEEGPLEVECRPERTGGTSTFTTLRATQAGETVALGLGVAAEWRDDQPEWDDVDMPDVPDPDEAPPVRSPRGAPPYLAKYEFRWGTGELGRPGSGMGGLGRSDAPARHAAWLRDAEGRPLDAPLLAAMADALMPPAFVKLGLGAVVPTIDLTLHFRSRMPEGEPWVLGAFESRRAAGGVVEEDGLLFGRDGTLLLQSRQLAILRRRPG